MRPTNRCRSAFTACAIALTAVLGAGAAEPDGAVPGVLPAAETFAEAPEDAAYASTPIAVDVRFRLLGAGSYNILVAHETKQSATHWELFTHPGSGFLSAYLPGRTPDHVHTGVSVTDGNPRDLTFVLEATRARFFIDGELRADQALTPPRDGRVPGPLRIGALVEGGLYCNGDIDEVRISTGIREGATRFEADGQTLALWHFADAARGADASGNGRHATVLDPVVASIPGGMSADFIPLPPPRDAERPRRLLGAALERAALRTVAPDDERDAVLRFWLDEYDRHGGTDYPEARSPVWADPNAVAAQVFDPEALVREGEGPLEAVLRRTRALADLRAAREGAPAVAAALEDLDRLQRTVARTAPARDSDDYLGLYLATAALRRRIALENPLLDVDGILCVARGTFAGSVRSNPATADAQGGHFATQYFGFNALPGGGLYIVRDFREREPAVTDLTAQVLVRNGRLAGQRLAPGAFATPDLAPDGERIAFAFTENREHRWLWSRKTGWHVFTIRADGTDLRMLTDGAVNDFDPCWLPDGGIAFVSDRREGYIRCFARGMRVRNYTLFRMADDGARMAPLSYYETSEWNPVVNRDGGLIYTRWDYTDRENCLGSRIWLSRADGSDPRAPHGNYPLPYHTFPDHEPWKVNGGREIDSRIGTPLVEMGIRPVPGSHLYLCTAAPHHGEVFGSLCMLDLRREDDGHMSQVRRVTPDEPFPESEMPGRRHYKYGTPYPLSEDVYLCNMWEDLILLDRFGNRELLCELEALPCKPDERLRIIDPIPLAPRRDVPEVPTRVAEPESPAQPRREPAAIAVMNVYETDLPFPEGTRIKWLRITQNILKSNHPIGEPMVGYERENTPRIPLGIVPVEEDGSAYFLAPVAKELIFQVLDENLMAVQSMRSVAYVHPGELLTCVGCHENPHKAPPVGGAVPLALRRPPSVPAPELGRVEPVSYHRTVEPIVKSTCLPCHRKEGKGPADLGYGALREDYSFWFSGAMWTDMTSAYSGVHGGSRTIPGRFGARASRIGQALLKEPHREAVTEAERRAVVLWLDSNSLRLGAYGREEAQLAGELVWPRLDVDPRNPLGLEGTNAPLNGMFWHESRRGPYPILVSAHDPGLVAVVSREGGIVRSYPVRNPQDVWMLPNGNILVASLHGVREIAPDGATVWDYPVEAPEETPTCQPLPDGRVLVGLVNRCVLREVDREGRVVLEIPLETPVAEPHARFRMCRKTPEGTYLVPFTAEGAVRELNAAGKVLREFPRHPSPVCAVRLPGGNTLISAGGMVTEYAPDNRVVWRLHPLDIPDIDVGILAGVQRLENGHTIVCNWGTRGRDGRAPTRLFEVTPDRRVVWSVEDSQFADVAQCALLTEDLLPADAAVRAR